MDVTMPQLGETVTEGTITRWLKQVGERVELDEPLFEVSTDKVDSEVPAAGAGVLTEILVPEGETVDVGVRLAVLGEGDGAAPAARAVTESEPVAAPQPEAAREPTPPPPPAAAPTAPTVPPDAAPPTSAAAPGVGADSVLASPIVRRLAFDRGVDLGSLDGSGDGGRITRNDVLAASPGAPVLPPAAPPVSTPATPRTAAAPPPQAPQVAETRPRATGDEVMPFDNIRKRTAEHMVRSKQTSAHVYTSVEVDFERVEQVRREHGAAWKAREGFSLTYLPFIVRAFSDAVDDFPLVNASVDGDSLVVHHDVNLGIAVDLDHRGLVAPVIKQVDGKRLWLIAREVNDLATRARNKGLGPDDVIGGTFTITNMGPFGTLMTLPIINQPQVAILATDAVRKRPVVVEGHHGDDAIAIHSVGVLALAWDHRAFDGAYAAGFLHALREVLETRDWEAELA
ncbi:MAG: dihydrolipoamide acetyltransferase family protein [Acidimicrobiia bacterium]